MVIGINLKDCVKKIHNAMGCRYIVAVKKNAEFSGRMGVEFGGQNDSNTRGVF